MKWKKNLILLFCILAGIIVGSLVASMTQGVPLLSWLSYSKTVGISSASPMILDFAVLRVAFGLELGVNVAQIIFIVLSFVLYRWIAKKV